MSEEESARLRECFTGLFSLSGEGSNSIIAIAREAPHNYVLKPQREGGGMYLLCILFWLM